MNKKKEELEEIYKELNNVKAREHKYFNELTGIKQSFNVEKDELYNTRAKLVELYEHYKLLESQLETKTALLMLAESTENDLKKKFFELESAFKQKLKDFHKFSDHKEITTQLLDQANKELESLMTENEKLKESENKLKYKSHLFDSFLTDLNEQIRWYDKESSSKTKLSEAEGEVEEKSKKITHQISTIFTESLVIMKQFSEISAKCSLLESEIENNKKNSLKTVDLSELSNIDSINKGLQTKIQDLNTQIAGLQEENDLKNFEIEKRKAELDTLKQKYYMIEKDLKLKVALLTQYEEKFSGDPDELLSRIQMLKNELEQFMENKAEKSSKAKEEEIKQIVERLNHAIHSIEPNLSCNVCFNLLAEAKMCLPCKHIVCTKCKVDNNCPQCRTKVAEDIKLQFIDELLNKIVYSKQTVEDMRQILNVSQ